MSRYKINGCDQVAKESAGIIPGGVLELWYDMSTRTVYTAPGGHRHKLPTALIRECTPDEIADTVIWCLRM